MAGSAHRRRCAPIRLLPVATKLVTRDSSRTANNRAVHSTVFRKVLMSVTGLFLVLFLLMHMFGNLKLLIPNVGLQEFDEYSHFLRTFLYPMLPERFFLMLFRGVLLLAAVVHIEAAVRLTFRDYDARMGMGRYLKQRYLAGSFAARTMIWSGVIIILGVIFHLLQFTTQTLTVGYTGTVEPHMRVILGFQQWWLVLAYAIFVGAVCLHIYHGFYSAFCTLGARVGAFSEKVIRVCSWIVCLLVFFGFMASPLAIFFGLVTA